jgi:hypothetical protein
MWNRLAPGEASEGREKELQKPGSRPEADDSSEYTFPSLLSPVHVSRGCSDQEVCFDILHEPIEITSLLLGSETQFAFI